MKSIFLFSTRLRMFLTELPPIIFLTFALIFNSKADDIMKLYPLIVVLAAIVILIFLYLFRAVIIRYDEVRTVGLFSSREHTVINENKTLVITLHPKRFMVIELFGDGGSFDTYSWLKSEDSTVINLFRAKAYGSLNTVKKILRYFEVDEEIILTLIAKDCPEIDLEKIKVSSSTVHEGKSVKIYFKETI